jgi:hypothetical protein
MNLNGRHIRRNGVGYPPRAPVAGGPVSRGRAWTRSQTSGLLVRAVSPTSYGRMRSVSAAGLDFQPEPAAKGRITIARARFASKG